MTQDLPVDAEPGPLLRRLCSRVMETWAGLLFVDCSIPCGELLVLKRAYGFGVNAEAAGAKRGLRQVVRGIGALPAPLVGSQKQEEPDGVSGRVFFRSLSIGACSFP